MIPESSRNLFALHLSGPPCSGKTTLENALAAELPGTYIVSFDRMKWQLAGYDRAKDGPLVDELVQGLFQIVCRKKISVILDFSFADEAEYQLCRKVTEATGHSFASIQLTAPVEVLLERFHRRIEHAARTGAKVTITDDEEFRETISKKFYVPPGTPKFDTSKEPIEKIVSEILGGRPALSH